MRKNGALERIEEADAVVDIAVGSDLGVGAGHADGRDAGFGEDRAARHGDAGAIGAENNGNAAVHQLSGSGGTVFRSGTVVNDLKLDLIFLAADADGGLNIVGILHAKDLLLAAGAVVAGLGLKHADLNDLFAGALIGSAVVAAAAGNKRKRHSKRQYKCKNLFHHKILLYCFKNHTS